MVKILLRMACNVLSRYDLEFNQKHNLTILKCYDTIHEK